MDKMRLVFSDTLGISPEMVCDDLSFNKIRQWDSVAHLALIAALEVAFDIFIDIQDVIDMSSFAKAKEIVARYVEEKEQ
jgi:acyl carrier protein